MSPKDRALKVALENVKKWGRSALPEQEIDPDFPIVHDIDLIMSGLAVEKDRTSLGDDGDSPIVLTPVGVAKLTELSAVDAYAVPTSTGGTLAMTIDGSSFKVAIPPMATADEIRSLVESSSGGRATVATPEQIAKHRKARERYLREERRRRDLARRRLRDVIRRVRSRAVHEDDWTVILAALQRQMDDS